MPTLTSGDTLSLNALAGANGVTQNSNVSLGTIKGSPSAGDNIGLSTFAVDSIDSYEGNSYTYIVEGTTETYTVGTTGEGSNFLAKNGSYSGNVTWTVPVGSKISLNTNSGLSATFDVGTMTNAPTQTILQSVETHTIRANFSDGYNDHIGSGNGYGVNKDKTVYSVDSYDGNSTALCLTTDTPIELPNGNTIELGDVEEGMILKGYSLNGLDAHDDSNYIDWNTNELNAQEVEVEVSNVVFSFASRYYNINNGEVKATAEHPFLVLEDGTYRFKRTHLLNQGDVLIKADEEVTIESIQVVDEDVEIVSLDVTNTDTYLANGFITHNKGGNSHTDFDGPTAPTTVSYSHPNLSWSGGTADSDSTGGITAFDIQVSANSDFSSPVIDETNWNASPIQLSGVIAAGTYYGRVRNKQSGLNSGWTTVGGNNSTFTVTAWPA
jgi:pSer/pThr/pTyr-binding forkhead associated (FHA) protein